jgi:hypothetical protein
MSCVTEEDFMGMDISSCVDLHQATSNRFVMHPAPKLSVNGLSIGRRSPTRPSRCTQASMINRSGASPKS